MSNLVVNEIELFYCEEGKGFPFILIHGLSADHTGWALVKPEFAKHYRIVTPDMRGHGQSAKPNFPYSIQDFSNDLNQLLEQLRIAQAHILGSSMGGAVAQQFALDQPQKIRSLILVSTFSYVDRYLHDNFTRLRDLLSSGGVPAFFDETVRLGFTSEFIETNAQDIAALRRQRTKNNSPISIGRALDACSSFDLKDKISALQVPTLIVSGCEDIFTPIHHAEQIHRLIGQSEWKILEGIGHNISYERAPELAAVVLEFLGRH